MMQDCLDLRLPKMSSMFEPCSIFENSADVILRTFLKAGVIVLPRDADDDDIGETRGAHLGSGVDFRALRGR